MSEKPLSERLRMWRDWPMLSMAERKEVELFAEEVESMERREVERLKCPECGGDLECVFCFGRER